MNSTMSATLATLPPELLALIVSFLTIPDESTKSDTPAVYEPPKFQYSAAHFLVPLMYKTPKPTKKVDAPKHSISKTLQNLRLVCRALAYDAAIFQATFKHLMDLWLDEKKSHRKVSERASLLCFRPVAVSGWSPWSLEDVSSDEEEVVSGDGSGGRKIEDIEWKRRKELRKAERRREREEVFVRIVWRLVMNWVLDDAQQEKKLTIENFAELSRAEEWTAKRLRLGMSRFRLHRRLMKENF
jgi:hypothetical protein